MFKKLLLTSALLATFASAHAQSSQNFGVTGTVSPAPCNVTLTNGVANLGSLSQATVKGYPVNTATSNSLYTIPTLNVPISIVCGAATKVEVSFVDNKPGKNIPMDTFDALRFGITDGAGTAAIGAYQMSFVTATTTIDSVPVGLFLNAPNGTTTWSKTVAGTPTTNNFIAPNYATGFAKSTTATIPESITTLSGTLAIQTFLAKTYIDSATSAISPTGSGTLTLAYL